MEKITLEDLTKEKVSELENKIGGWTQNMEKISNYLHEHFVELLKVNSDWLKKYR
jgi:uncharacterized protein HemX